MKSRISIITGFKIVVKDLLVVVRVVLLLFNSGLHTVSDWGVVTKAFHSKRNPAITDWASVLRCRQYFAASTGSEKLHPGW